MNRPFGFSAHRGAHSCLSCVQSQRAFSYFFFVPNFCLDRPFGSSIHQEAHFCLGRPFGFSTYHAVLFFLDKVFLDYIDINRIWEFNTIHVCENQSTTRESLLDNIRTFIVRCPLAPWVGLLTYPSFQHKFAFLEFSRSDFLVKAFFIRT